PRYFTGKLTAGVSLTGGWDTRMIMACHAAPPRTLPCYTFAGFSDDTLDVRQAREVARLAQQEYSVLRLGRDFLENFAEHAEKTIYVSDGNGTVSLSHELYLNRLARNVATARITGNFGSEALRGMTTFKELPLRSNSYPAEVRAEIACYKDRWKSSVEANDA